MSQSSVLLDQLDPSRPNHALWLAILRSDEQGVEEALARGANPNMGRPSNELSDEGKKEELRLRRFGRGLEWGEGEGWALAMAAERMLPRAVKALLAAGADPMAARPSFDQASPGRLRNALECALLARPAQGSMAQHFAALEDIAPRLLHAIETQNALQGLPSQKAEALKVLFTSVVPGGHWPAILWLAQQGAVGPIGNQKDDFTIPQANRRALLAKAIAGQDWNTAAILQKAWADGASLIASIIRGQLSIQRWAAEGESPEAIDDIITQLASALDEKTLKLTTPWPERVGNELAFARAGWALASIDEEAFHQEIKKAWGCGNKKTKNKLYERAFQRYWMKGSALAHQPDASQGIKMTREAMETMDLTPETDSRAAGERKRTHQNNFWEAIAQDLGVHSWELARLGVEKVQTQKWDAEPFVEGFARRAQLLYERLSKSNHNAIQLREVKKAEDRFQRLAREMGVDELEAALKSQSRAAATNNNAGMLHWMSPLIWECQQSPINGETTEMWFKDLLRTAASHQSLGAIKSILEASPMLREALLKDKQSLDILIKNVEKTPSSKVVREKEIKEWLLLSLGTIKERQTLGGALDSRKKERPDSEISSHPKRSSSTRL